MVKWRKNVHAGMTKIVEAAEGILGIHVYAGPSIKVNNSNIIYKTTKALVVCVCVSPRRISVAVSLIVSQAGRRQNRASTNKITQKSPSLPCTAYIATISI